MNDDPYDDDDDDDFFHPEREVESSYDGDDSTFSFRVNRELKTEFARLCKKERLSSAAILKRYMLQCVREGEVKL